MIAGAASASGLTRTLRDWRDAEFRPWTSARLTPDRVEARLRSDARRTLSICLYRIADGTVEFDPEILVNPGHFGDPGSIIGQRALAYLQHLRDAVRIFGVQGEATIGVFLADLFTRHLLSPTFFFQKPAGSIGLMIPDIDLLVSNYNADLDGRFDDRIPFDDKECRGVFVGSTTGDSPLTTRLIEDGRNARIAAARYFRERPEVDFDLPNICQHDNEATHALIRSFDIAGRNRDWAEQQRYRYQISIDGNGATCGRVAIALHSRSVLLKYASPNDLFYFRGLEPFVHYIPVHQNSDVLDMVREGARFQDLHARIAAESRRFAQTHLSRHAILSYTAEMLAEYLVRFGRGGGALLRPHDAPFVDSLIHLATAGAVWSEPGEWAGAAGSPIEGVALFPTHGLPWDALRYRAIGSDGAPTEIARGGQFCGTRRQGRALHGLALWLDEGSLPGFDIAVTERFADGSERAAYSPDVLVPHAAPLTGFRIALIPH